jgi:hypothetical protein
MRQSQNRRSSAATHADPRRVPPDNYGEADSRVPRKSRKLWPPIGVGLAGVLAILGTAALFPQQFKHQLEISFVRQPTPYTQLYFTNPSTLPVNLLVDQGNAFEFTIENDESRAHSYTYTVTADDSRSHLVVSTQTVTVGNGDSATRVVTVTPRDSKSRYLISITLEGMNQSIHFYGKTS